MTDALLRALGDGLDRFASVDPPLLVLAALLQVGAVGFRSLALRNVIRAAHPAARVRLLDVACGYSAGMALNGLLPAHGGDAAKTVLIRARVPGSSLATIAACMLVLGIFDAVVVAALIATAGAFGAVPVSPGAVWPDAVGTPAAALPVVAVLAASLALPAGRRVAVRLRTVLVGLRAQCIQAAAILRSPLRYALEVAAVQAGAWACRLGVVMALLGAFDLPASVVSAALVVVAAAASTLIPVTPGGAGAQQVALVYALGASTSAAAAASFSVGMQLGITSLNLLLGLLAAMVLMRTLCPREAVRRLRPALRGPA